MQILTILATLFGLYRASVNLGDATLSTSPNTYLTPDKAHVQALAALRAETPKISAEVLLGLAWVESRYYPNAVSRIEGGIRKTGFPKWTSPPAGTYNFHCGVTQIGAGRSWKRCQELQDVFLAYKQAVVHLNSWLSPRICNGNLYCALTGYNGGFPAIKVGTRYAATVMWRASLIKKARRP
jgi:hypothetical protein